MPRKHQSKTVIFRMRLTPEESTRLEERASKMGLTKSDFIRKKLGFKFNEPRSLDSEDVINRAASLDADNPLSGLADRIKKHSR